MMVSSGVMVILPLIKCFNFCYFTSKLVATPLWAKCEGEAHTPKSGNLESSGTPINSELELKGQNTSHWGVLSVIGKVLKCRCLNWPRIGHLNIWNPSYGQKKGRESNWQFDSRPLKVGNRPLLDVCSKVRHGVGKLSKRATTLVQTSSRSELGARSYGSPKSRDSKPRQFWDNFGIPPWEFREKEPFGCSLRAELQRIL
jgi:hypothetical protein